MLIFQHYCKLYCERILTAYLHASDNKYYLGKEAPLLLERNKLAMALIEEFHSLEGDVPYFDKLILHINHVLTQANKLVADYNNRHNATFTLDLFQSFFIEKLRFFIKNVVEDLYFQNPEYIQKLTHEDFSPFEHENPLWLLEAIKLLHNYILEKEFNLLVSNASRDIFDQKKQMVIKYLEKFTACYLKHEDESNEEYQNEIGKLLVSMQADETKLQQRNSHTEQSMIGFFTQKMYEASGKLCGKSTLAHLIEKLTRDFYQHLQAPQPKIQSMAS